MMMEIVMERARLLAARGVDLEIGWLRSEAAAQKVLGEAPTPAKPKPLVGGLQVYPKRLAAC